ncbi:MAG TPA: toll/interleukin-1 receptor domain-containing protein [Longimicrobium sp.]|nr:toll/interleukin-1 receptor domain-containing protein [Longimicrobium sp.]
MAQLVVGNAYFDDDQTWHHYRDSIQIRLRFLSNIMLLPPGKNRTLSDGSKSNPRSERLFISHASVDRAVAEYIQSQIQAAVPRLDVFLASVPGHIPVGADWLATIKDELTRATAYLILLTPASVQRPWIAFEMGAAWMSERTLLTVLAGELDRASIPMPLSSFQILSLESPREAHEVMKRLGGTLADGERFSAHVREIARTSEAREVERAGWGGVQVEDRFFAWSGPELWMLADRPSAYPPAGLIDALRLADLVPRYGNRNRLTNHLAQGRVQVFETDRKTWKREIVNAAEPSQVLLVRPAIARQ